VSILAWFSLHNDTVKDRRRRKTHLEHWDMLEKLLRDATYVLLADAHLNMNARVDDFLQHILPGREIDSLTLKGKNPACKRTLEVTYSAGLNQKPMDVSREAADVLQDPEKRIAVFCGGKDLLANKERKLGSYEDELRKAGLDKFKVIHGGVGEDEKQELVADLTGTLKACQAFLCNSAITVGLNPQVEFGAVIVHVVKGGACIRDLFQLIQRIGRNDGDARLSNKTVRIVINDKNPAQKEADCRLRK
jgi:hypothetical protein